MGKVWLSEKLLEVKYQLLLQSFSSPKLWKRHAISFPTCSQLTSSHIQALLIHNYCTAHCLH